MENTKYPLWERRTELQKPSIPIVIILAVVTVALASVTAAGFGGMLSVAFSGCAFAFLLISPRGVVPWLTLPVSFGAAFLLSGDIILSACTLLYVPVGLVLAYCAFTKRSLSVTVAALTVAILLSMGAIFTVSVTELYGGSLIESYKSFGVDAEKSLYEIFSSIKYPVSSEEVFVLPEGTISVLIETAVMILPAVTVVTCQLLAYITAKAFKAFLCAFGPREVFLGRDYGVTVSLPCAVIYLVSVAVSFFATEASVITYSAINLCYILMPACATCGFKLLFYKGGILRRSGRKNGLLIGTVVFLAIMSPMAFVQMLGSFSCIYITVKAAIEWKTSREQGQ